MRGIAFFNVQLDCQSFKPTRLLTCVPSSTLRVGISQVEDNASMNRRHTSHDELLKYENYAEQRCAIASAMGTTWTPSENHNDWAGRIFPCSWHAAAVCSTSALATATFPLAQRPPTQSLAASCMLCLGLKLPGTCANTLLKVPNDLASGSARRWPNTQGSIV